MPALRVEEFILETSYIAESIILNLLKKLCFDNIVRFAIGELTRAGLDRYSSKYRGDTRGGRSKGAKSMR